MIVETIFFKKYIKSLLHNVQEPLSHLQLNSLNNKFCSCLAAIISPTHTTPAYEGSHKWVANGINLQMSTSWLAERKSSPKRPSTWS